MNKEQIPKHEGTPGEEQAVFPYAAVGNDDGYDPAGRTGGGREPCFAQTG